MFIAHKNNKILAISVSTKHVIINSFYNITKTNHTIKTQIDRFLSHKHAFKSVFDMHPMSLRKKNNNPFLVFFITSTLCVYAVLSFLPLFGIFTTGPSPWSNRVAVPLPFLVCFYYRNYRYFRKKYYVLLKAVI